MSRIVELPPESQLRPDGTYAGGWWHTADAAGRIVCDLCPRECQLKPGDRGFCFVRQNLDGEMVLTTYGRSTGFCIDPIEKKPLNHFLPGTSVLSFGTAGCNLGCKFCQNWDISKSREVERLSEAAGPAAIAEAARQTGCRSVAYTYNDPVIWAEYAIDTAKACRAAGIKNVAVTAGYITPQARAPFYEYMDAANVDLKAFTEEFYFKITYSHLQPVLDTLRWLKHESDVWFEITNLMIPQANDDLEDVRKMCDWILEEVGDQVPLHFTAFHPDFRMRDRPPTPHATLLAAYDVARQCGLKHVYTGNVNDVVHQSTYCAGCGQLLIERNWYELGAYNLEGGFCQACRSPLAGVFEGAPGNWGRKRLPVQMSRFAQLLPILPASGPPSPASASSESLSPKLVSHEEPSMTSAPSPAASSTSSPRVQAQRPKLDAAQEQAIHQMACEAVMDGILDRRERTELLELRGAAAKTVMGAFVTLKRQSKLRACCGALGRPMPLVDALKQAARRTALEDGRLPPISPAELPFLDVDVTLLYGFQPLKGVGAERVREVVVGQHGLQIRRGESSGLLLPSVATEQGYDAEGFLQQVCRKAGLPVTAWQDGETIVQTFEGYSISGPFRCPAEDAIASPRVLNPADARSLADACRVNVLALLQGATPSYYLPGLPDGSVQGIGLLLRMPSLAEPLHLFRLSIRPGMPLQATLFSLCEAAANVIRQQRLTQVSQLQVGLTVLEGSAMHGTVAEPDLRGIDPARHAVMVMENGKMGWAFDLSAAAEELLAKAAAQAQVKDAAAASVLSFAAHSTETSLGVSNLPQPARGASVRPPAVAGSFYPGHAAELSHLVDRFLRETRAGEPEAWPALMVPHAGLSYSGRIAAQTLQRVRIPETVLVLGPKHTRLGVEWAVAPHDTWSIPGHTLASDPALARVLAESIPGLQLDAAAHQQEHAIEVELPFLAKLAPQAKIVGIAIGGGGLERCREFAAGLARVLQNLPAAPLLVISSDMNHYANDAETRQLDELALRALETLDPAQVYETVTGHGISMCGVLPAVIVLETLRQLGKLSRSTRVAYATSADTSGQFDRCVGYAGMLFG